MLYKLQLSKKERICNSKTSLQIQDGSSDE